MAFGTPEIVDVTGEWTPSKRTYDVVLQIENSVSSQSVGKNAIAALTATGIPKINNYLDLQDGMVDTRAFCTKKRAVRPDPKSKAVWHILLHYETLTREQKKRIQHPLQRPAEISDGYSIFSTAKIVDIFGNAIMNTAGQPFDPPIEAEDARLSVTVTRNFANRIDSLYYNNRLNVNSFLGASAGTLRCLIEQQREIEEWDEFGDGNPVEVEFWRSTGLFEYRPEGWQPSVLNAGLNQLSGGTLKRITEGLVANAPPVADPWPLDINGAAITPANLPGSAISLTYNTFYYADFESIGFF